jgi:dipeptide/tripeptide permease
MSYFRVPKGYYSLGIALLLERFAFFGIVSILVQFLTQQPSFSQSDAGELVTQFRYSAPLFLVVGGATVDYFLTGKRSLAIAGLFYLIGTLLVILAGKASSSSLVYVALGLIMVGHALFRPMLYSQIVNFYDSEDDPGLPLSLLFLPWFMNIGSFLATLFCGRLANEVGLDAGFLVASIAAGGIILLTRDVFTKKEDSSSQKFINKTLILTVMTLAVIALVSQSAVRMIGEADSIETGTDLSTVVELLHPLILPVTLPFLWMGIRRGFPDVSIKTCVMISSCVAIVTGLALYASGLEHGITRSLVVISSIVFFSLAEVLAFASMLANTPSRRRATVSGGFDTMSSLITGYIY